MAAPNFGPPNFGPQSDLGFNSPMRFEGEVYDCEVEGAIPADLEGTFYRVGPNRTYPQRFADDIPFNGDGMASLFRISGGACDFKQKYVKTQRYLAERSAKKALFGRYRNRNTIEDSAKHLSMGTANTHIYWHSGKLMALKEDSPPVLLDPHTLETIDNYHTFGGQLTSLTFTAHPKIDGRTGEMIAYGYEAAGDNSTDIALYSFNRRGEKTWEAWIDAPYVSMMHDIALTENYVIIPTTGYTTSQERLDAGLVHWAYDESVPIFCGVMPRGGSAADVRWFQAPHRCIVHTVSAREERGRILFDFQAHDAGPFPFFANWDGSPFDPVKARSRIMRWTMDMNSPDERVVEETLFPDIHTGLPRFDERFTAREYRLGFSSEAPPNATGGEGIGGAGPGGSSQLTRWDIATREVIRGDVGEGRSLSEVVFAPRSRGGREGEGYLLAVANVPETMSSELVIMDAENLAGGVVARVILPFRAHGQVHGSWVPRWDVDFPDAMTERPV